MYQKIKAKFKANPTIFYACSIVASWAGVGSLMNFRTLAINNGAAAAIIWAVFNSLACIFFGLFAEYIPTVRRIMQSKVMFYFIGFLTVFQTWTQMSGIYEIFGDTPIGTTGGTLIVYGTCLVFLFMLLKEGMIFGTSCLMAFHGWLFTVCWQSLSLPRWYTPTVHSSTSTPA